MSALVAVRLQPAFGSDVPLVARFSYARVDPYAVRVEFLAEDTALPSWCFDRQMLAEGLHRPVGEGEVTFRPQWTDGGEALRIGLRDFPDGRGAVLLAGVRAVTGFLEATYAVTAPGSETFDADGLLEELLDR
ncbi:SsgA family sporulation/cell division regulator [Streptomyces sp. NPDC006512]|uniref:SsgA family sporulation/cell division regulator n=1 Tax=Streptomyces sp. NPDC006512 TaxID=3154307 RepID=UPI0033B117E6